MSSQTNIPVSHIAKLANIPVSKEEEKSLETAFQDTIKVIDQLKDIDVKDVEPTFQVTGLTNVLREDVVNQEKMCTQKQALANAKTQYQGFFVVDQVIEQD